MSTNGKGSKPRPYSVSLDTYGKNFDAIFRKPSPKEIEDAKAEDEEFARIDKEQKRYNNLNNNKEG